MDPISSSNITSWMDSPAAPAPASASTTTAPATPDATDSVDVTQASPPPPPSRPLVVKADSVLFPGPWPRSYIAATSPTFMNARAVTGGGDAASPVSGQVASPVDAALKTSTPPPQPPAPAQARTPAQTPAPASATVPDPAPPAPSPAQKTIEEAEPDFSNKPYDALQDAWQKGLLPKNMSDSDRDQLMKTAWTIQQRNAAAGGGVKLYAITGAGTFQPVGDDPVASVDSAMKDGVLDARTGMQLRDQLTRGMPVDFNQYRGIAGRAAVHGNEIGFQTMTSGPGSPPGVSGITFPGIINPAGDDGKVIRMPDGRYGRIHQGWDDGRYYNFIIPLGGPGEGSAPPASTVPQPDPPPQTEAGSIRAKYLAGEIDKATALRLLSTIGRTPSQTAQDEAGKIAYETAKSGVETLGGIGGGALGTAAGALTGPGAFIASPVLGGAGFMAGSELTHRGIEALEHYLAGHSDTFASGLEEQQDAPYAQAIGQTIPMVAMAGGSLKGYLKLAQKGLAPVIRNGLASMAGAGGSNAFYTAVTQGRVPTWQETLQALAAGCLYGGSAGNEKKNPGKVTGSKIDYTVKPGEENKPLESTNQQKENTQDHEHAIRTNTGTIPVGNKRGVSQTSAESAERQPQSQPEGDRPRNTRDAGRRIDGNQKRIDSGADDFSWSEQDLEYTRKHVQNAVEALKERIRSAKVDIDQDSNYHKGFSYDPDAKRIDINPRILAPRLVWIKYFGGDPQPRLRAGLLEEITHHEINEELLEQEVDPIVKYWGVYARLSPPQRAILEAVYKIDDQEIEGSNSVTRSSFDKERKWGAEWLRYQRMMERGETWPEEYFTPPDVIEALKRAIRLTPASPASKKRH